MVHAVSSPVYVNRRFIPQLSFGSAAVLAETKSDKAVFIFAAL